MTITAVVHIPLELAALCICCEAVFQIQPACPACSSDSVVSLSRWINREGP